MSIEHARAHIVPKPWGVLDLHPWSNESTGGKTIGEIWFERSDHSAIKSSLLLKLLFTSEPLSIQVHPGDAYAHSIGLPNGKTEAWHILSADPGAKVALGLAHRLNPQQLRDAITSGSISTRFPGMPYLPATRSSYRPEQFTRSAQDLSSRKFSSVATQHIVCSITVASASFILKVQSLWRTLARPNF